MRQEELSRRITELAARTKEGKIRWSVEVQTTEANDPEKKPVEEDGDIAWTIDECYVSYYCSKYQGEDFCMITYEMLKTAGERVESSNLVFMPPLGVRFFDLRTLLPYSVETSAMLLDQIHRLWLLLLDMYKVDRGSVYLDVRPGSLTIED